MIRKPFNEKIELLRNLGARRAMLQEQKIQPLTEEFETEITEHSVLNDLKITRLFKDFVEYYNEYLDTTEESYNQVLAIINEMLKINDDEYVPKTDFEQLQRAYENALAKIENYRSKDEEKQVMGVQRDMRAEADLAKTFGDEEEFDMAREKFAKRVKKYIDKALEDGKAIIKMKKAARDKLKTKFAWQGRMIDFMIEEAVKSQNKETGPTPAEIVNKDADDAEEGDEGDDEGEGEEGDEDED